MYKHAGYYHDDEREEDLETAQDDVPDGGVNHPRFFASRGSFRARPTMLLWRLLLDSASVDVCHNIRLGRVLRLEFLGCCPRKRGDVAAVPVFVLLRLRSAGKEEEKYTRKRERGKGNNYTGATIDLDRERACLCPFKKIVCYRLRPSHGIWRWLTIQCPKGGKRSSLQGWMACIFLNKGGRGEDGIGR